MTTYPYTQSIVMKSPEIITDEVTHVLRLQMIERAVETFNLVVSEYGVQQHKDTSSKSSSTVIAASLLNKCH